MKLKPEKKEYNQCINCRRACAASGMCMRQWPEFVIAKRLKDAKNAKKNRKN